MARMFPPTIPADWKSSAEHDVFERLERELSHEWTCLHSVGLAKHEKKVWAEIDFVLVGPPGILCLEVKGGQIRRENGIWIFRNRHGRENQKREGPFEQVGSAAGALKGFLRSHEPKALKSITGHGVVAPDVEWTIQGPDIDPELVLDRTSWDLGMNSYVRKLTETWSRRFREQRGFAPRELTRDARDAVTACLRGDFDLVPSLPTRIGHIKNDLIRLTQEQSDYLGRLSENPRVLVRGGAGTGKTVLAFEEAQRAAQSGASVLYLCFNRLLANSLRAKAPHGVTVSTIHSLMAGLVEEAGLTGDLPPADDDDLYEVFFPTLALQALSSLTNRPAYDLLVIDEGQDILLPNYLEVLDELVIGGLEHGRWRVFYDPDQNLFNGIAGPAIAKILSLQPTTFPLTRNCRNTEQIAAATAMFSGCTLLATSAQGPKVETLWYQNPRDQGRVASNHVRRLLSEGVRPSDIVILSRKTLKRSCLADGWDEPVGATLTDFAHSSSDDEGEVRFSTITAFKGLEADVVVLLDAVSTDLSSRYLTYVGASRARAVLAILLDKDESEEITARYEEFGKGLLA